MFGSKLAKVGAAGAAAAGGLLGTDEAEAGVIFKGARAARDFAGRVANDLKAPNIIPGVNRKTGLTEEQAFNKLLVDLKDMADQGNIQEWAKSKPPFFNNLPPKAKENWGSMSTGQRIGTMKKQRERRIAEHMHTYLDYNGFSKRMQKKEGGVNGAGYLTGLDIAYEEMLERIPDAFQKDLEGYAKFRMGDGFVGRPEMAGKFGDKDLKGSGLRDRNYYERLHNNTFQHTATQEPKKSAAQVLAEADAENAARRAAEEAKRVEADRIASEANAITATEGEPAKARTGRPIVDRSKLKGGLLGGGGAGGAGGAGAATMNTSDGLMTQSPSSVGSGPTAEERLSQPYVDDRIKRENQPEIMAPRSDALQQITMGARGIQRDLEGSPGALLFPDGLVNYLETVNRPNEKPSWLTRGMALLDVF